MRFLDDSMMRERAAPRGRRLSDASRRIVSAPIASRSASSASLADLAAILARAYLRLAERSRNGDVSYAIAEQIPLEVPGPESPDHHVERATRRTS